jgi:hypothetical protein
LRTRSEHCARTLMMHCARTLMMHCARALRTAHALCALLTRS